MQLKEEVSYYCEVSNMSVAYELIGYVSILFLNVFISVYLYFF